MNFFYKYFFFLTVFPFDNDMDDEKKNGWWFVLINCFNWFERKFRFPYLPHEHEIIQVQLEEILAYTQNSKTNIINVKLKIGWAASVCSSLLLGLNVVDRRWHLYNRMILCIVLDFGSSSNVGQFKVAQKHPMRMKDWHCKNAWRNVDSLNK